MRITRKSTHRCASRTWLSWLSLYYLFYLIYWKSEKHRWLTDLHFLIKRCKSIYVIRIIIKNVLDRDQPRLQDHLRTVVALLETWEWKLLRRPAQVLRQNPRPNCLFLPRVSPVRKLMTMSQRKIVSETTLKMILMSQSWGWDPVAPSLVPGQLASRSKQVGDPV